MPRIFAWWCIASVSAAPLVAQVSRHDAPHHVQWWEAAAVAGGLALSLPLDEPLRNSLQRHRTQSTDDVASSLRRFGQPEVFGTVGLGTVAVGLLARRPAITRAGLRISSSIALAAIWGGGGKLLFGRWRPYESPGDAFRLNPFSSHDAFPSGHTTFAFALATSVSDELHRPWVSALLFTAAAGTGWSRLNDDRHWLSDVLTGAAVGISSAQLIEGRWTIFHIRPPRPLMTPSGLGLGWSATF